MLYGLGFGGLGLRGVGVEGCVGRASLGAGVSEAQVEESRAILGTRSIVGALTIRIGFWCEAD